jgi:iron(II)-dependent oxidoreductase
MATRIHTSLTRERIAELLTEARARTLLLIAPLTDEDLRRQHDPLMSPIVWDLGHIAHFEELWLLQDLEGGVVAGELSGTYDPFRNPRATRDRLNLPGRDECLTLLAGIRRQVLERLESVDLDSDAALLRDGFVYRMVLQHEYQHDETILQTLQLKKGDPYPAPRGSSPPAPAAGVPAGMVRFPGGPVEIGTDDRGAAYDNERPRHVVSAPRYWTRDGGGWRTRSMDRVEPVDPSKPVCHVSFHEAEAYARFAGKRLPTELEWEAAASWDPETGEKRTYPWGEEPPGPRDANLDQLAFGTAQVGAYPRNVSPIGCHGLIGDVWEWTSSDFRGYPGFETFPYEEYSEVFFGTEYKVLRGGSWATRPGAIRNTFRNWDFPIRRQIFSGFRCARDD